MRQGIWSKEACLTGSYHSHQSSIALSRSYWFMPWTDGVELEGECSQTWLSMTSGSRVCLWGTHVLWLVSVEKMSISVLFWLPGWWLLSLWLRFKCNKHLTLFSDLTPDSVTTPKGILNGSPVFNFPITFPITAYVHVPVHVWQAACVWLCLVPWTSVCIWGVF